ncbi:MAG: hypothetical protein SGI92_30680 [Bryobacteraceae bacterium]|nr:hypothetical protein [Bryobacteraceae bacterium]
MLDSSAVIAAERKKQPIVDFIESILATHGPVDSAALLEATTLAPKS